MITYRVRAREDIEEDPYFIKVRVYVEDQEYVFEARKRGGSYLSCALNAAMFYSRSLGYGMRVLNVRKAGRQGRVRTYDITIAKDP